MLEQTSRFLSEEPARLDFVRRAPDVLRLPKLRALVQPAKQRELLEKLSPGMSGDELASVIEEHPEL